MCSEGTTWRDDADTRMKGWVVALLLDTKSGEHVIQSEIVNQDFRQSSLQSKVTRSSKDVERGGAPGTSSHRCGSTAGPPSACIFPRFGTCKS